MLTQLEAETSGATAARDPDRGRSDGPRPLRWSGWSEGLVAAVVSGVFFVVGFGGGWSRLSLPLGGGDRLPAYATASLWSEGSPFGSSSLGFPFGMDLRYYPTGDVLQNAVAGLAGSLWGNPFLGMNLVFALSFPITALAVVWVFRIAELTGPFAVLAAVALTVVPYHWYRIEHVYLGTMYSAVLGVGLALLVGNGTVQRRLRSPDRLRFLLLVAAMAVAIGLSGIYYACFTILLCGVALLYRAARGARWRDLLLGALPAIAVVVVLGTALAPASLHVLQHPGIDPVADRHVVESVLYSGALIFTLLPAPISRIPGFGPLNDMIADAFGQAELAPTSGVLLYANFGSVATVIATAVLAIGGFVLVRRASRRRAEGDPERLPAAGAATTSLGLVGLLLTTVVLFFVPWGLNYLFAYLVTPQLRGWDRLVPVLFTLVFVGAGLVVRRLGLGLSRPVAAGVLGLSFLLLVCDSVLPHRAVFTAAAANGSTFGEAGYAYAKALNSAVPGRCGVLELPYVAYPEEPPKVGLGNYEHFWPALTNPGKLWSFGAMKGTLSSAWQKAVSDDIEATDIPSLEAGGFCAVHVDTRGYSPEDATEVTDGLEELLGEPVAEGLGGTWLAYVLPAPGDGNVGGGALADASGELGTFYAPPKVVPGDGAPATPAVDSPQAEWWLPEGRAEFEVRSLDGGADFSSVTGELRSASCAGHDVELTLQVDGGDTVTRTMRLEADGASPFDLEFPATRHARLTVATTAALCPAANGIVEGAIALIDPRGEG